MLFLLLCLTVSFASAQSYQDSIPNEASYQRMQGKPTSEKYGKVNSVKVVWDLKKDHVYFINSSLFEWHYDFCRRELGYWKDNFAFNAQNYGKGKSREFALANLNQYVTQGLWALEFSPADLIPSELVVAFHRKLRELTFFGQELRLFLNTQRLEMAFASDSALAVVKPEEIYAGQTYQALFQGKAYGYLRKIPVADLRKRVPGPRDIVVLDGTPLDLSATAGVVTNEFQTPLSHVNVLCQNRKTAFMAQRSIWESPQVDSLEWDLVYLEVQTDTFVLRKATLDEAIPWWESRLPKSPIKLRRKTDRKDLIPVAKLNHRMVNEVGGKAANFGTLARLAKASKGGFKVPEGGFAIPFHWYMEHMKKSGADSILMALLQDASKRSDPLELEKELKKIRKKITDHPLDEGLRKMIFARVRSDGGSLRMRFRSSTNAEDVDGFNGAGLYTSKTGWVKDSVPKKTVARAIRKVWASTWSIRAFQEREYFGLRQEDVAMGILVHRSFPEEHANGVAITKNLYRKSYHGFVINVQLGEVSVVSPPEGISCDQLICYSESDLDFFRKKDIIEYISHSTFTNGKPVLSQEEVVHLTEQLARIKKYYYWNVAGNARKSEYKDFGLDIEFKLDGDNRQLYIKQVRPF